MITHVEFVADMMIGWQRQRAIDDLGIRRSLFHSQPAQRADAVIELGNIHFQRRSARVLSPKTEANHISIPQRTSTHQSVSSAGTTDDWEDLSKPGRAPASDRPAAAAAPRPTINTVEFLFPM